MFLVNQSSILFVLCFENIPLIFIETAIESIQSFGTDVKDTYAE